MLKGHYFYWGIVKTETSQNGDTNSKVKTATSQNGDRIVASKALQIVACCVYKAHRVDLQAQQACTYLSMSVEEFFQSSPRCLPTVANTGLILKGLW